MSQLDTAVHSIVKEGYHLAEPSLADDGEQVPILGLAGVDIIQRFPEFALTSCMLGAAFSTSLGLIPFGNILNFCILAKQFLFNSCRQEKKELM